MIAIEKKGGATIGDLAHLVTGQRGKLVYETGDPEYGMWTAGMVQGIIHDVPTVKELIHRIVAEAEEIISRLGGVFSALPAASR